MVQKLINTEYLGSPKCAQVLLIILKASLREVSALIPILQPRTLSPTEANPASDRGAGSQTQRLNHDTGMSGIF